MWPTPHRGYEDGGTLSTPKPLKLYFSFSLDRSSSMGFRNTLGCLSPYSMVSGKIVRSHASNGA